MGCQGGSCNWRRSGSNSGSFENDRKPSNISVKVTAKDTDAAYAVSTPKEKFLAKCCNKNKQPKERSLFDCEEKVKTTYVPKQYYINTGHIRQRLSMKFPCGGNMPNIHGIVQCQPERQPVSTYGPPVEIYVPSMHTVISKTQATQAPLDLCSLKHLEAPCCVQQCDDDIEELANCCDPDPCCDRCGDNPCSPCCSKTQCSPSRCCCQPICCPQTYFSKNNSKSMSVLSVPRTKTPPPRPRSITPPIPLRAIPRPAPRLPSIHTSVYSNKSHSASPLSRSDECLSVEVVNETPVCKSICKLRLASLVVLYFVMFIGLLIIMCLNGFGTVFVVFGNVLLLYLTAYDFFISRDPVHQLEDHDADAILRLRSGNTALLSNLKEIGLAKCSICPCREAEETVNHVLQECRLYNACRNVTWPCGGDAYSKLYGKADQMEKTVRFFEHIGLRIRLDDRMLEECCM